MNAIQECHDSFKINGKNTQKQHRFKIYHLDKRRTDFRKWYIRGKGKFPLPEHLHLKPSRFGTNSNELTNFKVSYRLHLAGHFKNQLYFFSMIGEENLELLGCYMAPEKLIIFRVGAHPHSLKLRRDLVRKAWTGLRKEVKNG